MFFSRGNAQLQNNDILWVFRLVVSQDGQAATQQLGINFSPGKWENR